MAEKKDAGDLLDEPMIMGDSFGGSLPQSPFDKGFEMLSTTADEDLEIMTRTTPAIVEAAMLCYNITCNFNSSYVRGRYDQIMRLAVSMGGKGRQEIVDITKGGSGVTDGFYSAGDGSRNSFSEV